MIKMQFKQTLCCAIIFILPCIGFSQSTLIPFGSKEYQLIDRLEIKMGKDTILNFSGIKPFSRKQLVTAIEMINSQDSADPASTHLTKVDRYNIQGALMDNSEWVTGDKSGFASRKPFLKLFFKNKAHFFEVDQKDFYLAIDPVLQLKAGAENANSDMLFINTKGIVARGLIAKKVGFYTYVTDNQERTPFYVRDFVSMFKAVPGAGFFKPFKTTGYDYLDARGYVTFNAAKYIDFQFGFDKNVLGDGNRSLFMSDFGNSYLFLKLNTRVWRLNYQVLYTELIPEYESNNGDQVLPRKYMTSHHLTINAPKWLTLGVFDAVVFGRVNHFDFAYLNPIIFLRPAESNLGSGDNAIIGFDAKANLLRHLQLYSQITIDEFKLSEMKKGGWWGNKYAIQAGAKYIDAFGLKNLDLQGEFNMVRPFTYTHTDSVSNWTHYNQPLAHPLGANFYEAVAIANYQPAPKWYIQAKLFYSKQGVDTAGINYGSNIFLPNTTRPYDYGWYIGAGREVSCVNSFFTLSYEWQPNLYFEGTFQVRKRTGTPSETIGNVGIRWNIFRREYEF